MEKSCKQKVYFSELLKMEYPDTWKNLEAILNKHNVRYGFLKETKDIWCRDYMPVQTTSGKLIQFKYEPTYLKGYEKSRSDVEEVCRLNHISPIFSNINLDGGNVLLCEDRAIISDRIFKENPTADKDALVQELSELLEAEVIIIPAQNCDMTGHADGMVRFVNRNTILGNKLSDELIYWRDGMNKVIEKYGLTYLDVPFFTTKNSSKHKGVATAIGVYVNYLEVNDLLIVPVFGKEVVPIMGTVEDDQVLDILHRTFPDKVIETINYNDIAKEGGLLNCTTWVVNE